MGGLLESRAWAHTQRFKIGERRRPMADSVWRKLQYCIIAENFGEVFNSNGEFSIDRQIKNSPIHASMAISITILYQLLLTTNFHTWIFLNLTNLEFLISDFQCVHVRFRLPTCNLYFLFSNNRHFMLL